LDKQIDFSSDIAFVEARFSRDVAVAKEFVFLMPTAGHSDYKENDSDLGAIKR